MPVCTIAEAVFESLSENTQFSCHSILEQTEEMMQHETGGKLFVILKNKLSISKVTCGLLVSRKTEMVYSVI